MDDFVSELRDEVTKGKGPKIIYVHCSAGVDRTGYVAGSYRMKYKKESY
jgi:protein-tyrosine phosphatase